MNYKSQNQIYFNTISTIEDFIEAEKTGFSANFRTNIPEMPGASFFHQICRCCYIELIEFIYKNRQIEINLLDEDVCTPLGYVVNDDVYAELVAENNISTVNLGCENPQLIIKTIKYLLSIGCEAVYCEKKYSEKFINSYIDLLNEKL